ncbi:unnamed protein product [Phytophthora fragariaefolia]|uniref:Unnamed protein product n=1 Tax=Phytophthora fragariaefolia TaxID=1490495 RepID=A0A9W6YDQ8_9STRA|nr:unnamed protein product [Phytophthora fragariaefolia]
MNTTSKIFRRTLLGCLTRQRLAVIVTVAIPELCSPAVSGFNSSGPYFLITAAVMLLLLLGYAFIARGTKIAWWVFLLLISLAEAVLWIGFDKLAHTNTRLFNCCFTSSWALVVLLFDAIRGERPTEVHQVGIDGHSTTDAAANTGVLESRKIHFRYFDATSNFVAIHKDGPIAFMITCAASSLAYAAYMSTFLPPLDFGLSLTFQFVLVSWLTLDLGRLDRHLGISEVSEGVIYVYLDAVVLAGYTVMTSSASAASATTISRASAAAGAASSSIDASGGTARPGTTASASATWCCCDCCQTLLDESKCLCFSGDADCCESFYAHGRVHAAPVPQSTQRELDQVMQRVQASSKPNFNTPPSHACQNPKSWVTPPPKQTVTSKVLFTFRTFIILDEDRKLKEDLETAVARVCDRQEALGVKQLALELLRREIRSATSSMTSVPKPLKFLRPSYDHLKAAYEALAAGDTQKLMADVLAVLAMTMAKEGSRESLRFKLLGNSTDLGSWGHEFVRSLAGEVGEEYNARVTAEDAVDPDVRDLLEIVDAIVPFHMQHNAEPEAIDILIEVQQLSKLLDSPDIDEKNYQRVCLYLLACADFMSDADDLVNLLNTAYSLFLRLEQYPDALRVALRVGNDDFVAEVFQKCKDDVVCNQMGYILGRQRCFYEDESEASVNEIIGNSDLSDKFLSLARDLDVMEAKTPEDIYKSHLSETASVGRGRDSGSQPTDSARANLASTFVNALVNAGYGTDKLMTPEGNTWLYKNKKHGMMSAAASLGMIMLWNVEEGITQIDKYLYSGDEYVKAGAILGVGVVSAGIRNDCDPALALLSEHIDSGNCSIRCASCLGLGIAYAGSAREDVSELLIPVVSHADENADIQEVSYAALALGMVEVGTCDDEAGSVLMQRLMESSDAELDSSCARFLALGLGLLRQERVEAMLEAAKTIEHKMSKYLAVTLETCAYAGSGNVLKVQQLLRTCAEHIEDPVEAQHQSVAVLGIALITMGENIGSEMAMRSFDHLLQYGEVAVRRAVPLAFALLSVSNPEYSLIDTLSRLTHDVDTGVAQNAILALGLVAAGTNNSRVAGLLRQLSEFYSREANHLFVVRIAQGLLHMGKGLMTLHPFHSDRLIMSRVAVSGLLTILHASLDMEHTILDTSHYILYCIATAMQPRMLITLDEELNPLPVSVRVGQAVEIVGQAGRPKSITGFQTHTTPVLLNVKDRAELATEEYLPLTNVLEGVVILRKNPDYEPET